MQLSWISSALAGFGLFFFLNQDKLSPWAVAPLPVGSIKPAGWLKQELHSVADGLAGHQFDFYRFVKDSRWLYPQGSTEGTDYSNLEESLPYWLNAIVPLAYTLDDERLKRQVHEVVKRVLSLQTQDGYLGPEIESERNVWARMPLLLGLTQLVEANSTWEKPVLTSIRRYMTLVKTMLHNNGTGFINSDTNIDLRWGQARVADLYISIQWLLEKYPSEQDDSLWDTMRILDRLNPIRWEEWYDPKTFSKVVADPSPRNEDFKYTHAVNVGQGLKASAVAWRFKHKESHLLAAANAVNLTFTYHGAPSGTILGDEIERDLAPYMGSELCTAVETSYSMAYVYHALGTNSYADRAELINFNAFPVMLADDGWAHQYMSSPNQPWAINTTQDFKKGEGHAFTTANSGVSTTYGLEPQYPCCTVNYAQSWPKFLTHSWGTVDKGASLAHIFLIASTVTTTLCGNIQVNVSCETRYPFENELVYTVEATSPFSLYLRVPEWFVPETSSISVNHGQPLPLSPSQSTGLHLVSFPRGRSTIKYVIGAEVRVEPRANSSISVYHGNLLFALEIKADISSSLPHAFYDPTGPGISDLPFPQLRDYYFTNASAWNIAIDPSTLQYHPAEDMTSGSIFSASSAVPYITVQGCRIDWPLYLGVTPDWPPSNPKCLDEPKEYRMIIYGAAKLHMSELPTIQL